MVKSNKGNRAVDPIAEDKRFSKVSSDPLFREISTRERKVVIDDRFKQMFKDDRFKIGAAKVDKRGRKIDVSSNDHLRALYDLEKSSDDESGESTSHEKCSQSSKASFSAEKSDDEEDELMIKLDLARGDGNVSSSSSSDDSELSENEIDEDQIEDLTTELERNAWGELDRNVKRMEWTSRRIAICNLEWDRLSAEDLLVVLNSFKPASGKIHSVSIYLSDFGAERVGQEEKCGPILGLFDTKNEKNEEAAIRAYQLDRLRYYYAVCECDTPETAAALYENCDGVEYETSGMRFDIRFIPDEMQFNETRVREKAHAITADEYKPKSFESTALSNVRTKLTWDETNPERIRAMRNAFKDNADLSSYHKMIAPVSDSEDDEETKRKRLELLLNPDDTLNKFVDGENNNEPKEDIRIDWELPNEMPSEKTNELLERNNNQPEDKGDLESEEATTDDEKNVSVERKKLTPFQEYMQRRKEKRKERKAKIRELKLQRKIENEDLSTRIKAQKRRKATTEAPKNEKTNGMLDLSDARFSSLFTDSEFAIDRTHSLYRGGNLADQQVQIRSAKQRCVEDENGVEQLADRIKNKMKQQTRTLNSRPT